MSDVTALSKPGKPLVERSTVPFLSNYVEYKRYLRQDFFFSCAYCTTTESEAQAVRFTIDHYDPKSSAPGTVAVYYNLMYCCDACNVRKGARNPPLEAREQGYRFYRPDNDIFEDHFQLNDLRINSASNVGYFTIEAVDLNRLELRRIRGIRSRLTNCADLVAKGVLALREYSIDKIPRELRMRAATALADAPKMAEEIADEIDSLLTEYAKSPIVLDENEREIDDARLGRLRDIEALFPGSWRSPKKAKASL